jgi:hypothetical protein
MLAAEGQHLLPSGEFVGDSDSNCEQPDMAGVGQKRSRQVAEAQAPAPVDSSVEVHSGEAAVLARLQLGVLALQLDKVPVSALALGIGVLGESLALREILGLAFIGLGLAAIDGRIARRLWLRPVRAKA